MKTEVIAVFREEQKGEEGLKAIKKKTSTSYMLALDNGKKRTARYSSGKGEFTGYVISPQGVVVEIIQGDLRKRANSQQLLDAIAASSKSSSGTSGTKANSGSGSKGSSKR